LIHQMTPVPPTKAATSFAKHAPMPPMYPTMVSCPQCAQGGGTIDKLLILKQCNAPMPPLSFPITYVYVCVSRGIYMETRGQWGHL
jgi:hypothetical protein